MKISRSIKTASRMEGVLLKAYVHCDLFPFLAFPGETAVHSARSGWNSIQPERSAFFSVTHTYDSLFV